MDELDLYGGDHSTLFAHSFQHVIELLRLIYVTFQILHLSCGRIFAQQTFFLQKIIHRVQDKQYIICRQTLSVLRRDSCQDKLHQFPLFRFQERHFDTVIFHNTIKNHCVCKGTTKK